MPVLAYISPFFIVSNLMDSVSFYLNKLGFELLHNSPKVDPFFAIVGRDQVSVMLKEIDKEVKPSPNYKRHEWARWDAFIYTEEPDEIFEEYRSKDVVFHQPLMDDSDGLTGFAVSDADGYVLFFGRPNTRN